MNPVEIATLRKLKSELTGRRVRRCF